MDKYIVIARIGKAHGLGGDCLFYPFSDSVEEIFNFSTFYRKEGNIFIPLSGVTFKNIGAKLIAKIKGVSSVEELRPLINSEIYILKEELPVLGGGEYYYYEIIGCKCYYEGNIIGEVRNIVDYGAGELFEIEGQDAKAYFIPFLRGLIVSISISDKLIYFKELEGFI